MGEEALVQDNFLDKKNEIKEEYKVEKDQDVNQTSDLEDPYKNYPDLKKIEEEKKKLVSDILTEREKKIEERQKELMAEISKKGEETEVKDDDLGKLHQIVKAIRSKKTKHKGIGLDVASTNYINWYINNVVKEPLFKTNPEIAGFLEDYAISIEKGKGNEGSIWVIPPKIIEKARIKYFQQKNKRKLEGQPEIDFEKPQS